MFNIRLAGDHLYGKWLLLVSLRLAGDHRYGKWLLLVKSLMVSYFMLLSFSSRDVLDEIWD